MTNEQIQNYRDALTAYAKAMNVSLYVAFNSTVTPDWVWSECVAAREAVGPAPVAPEGMDVLASLWLPDTPERDAAAKAKYDEIRTLVCG